MDVVAGLLERWPEASVSFSAVRFVGLRRGVWSADGLGLPVDEPMDIRWHAFRHTLPPAMAVAVRRRVYLEAGGCDEALTSAMDFDLWLRLAFAGHLFVRSDHVTACYRWHGRQISCSGTQTANVYRARAKLVHAARQRGDEDVARRLWSLLGEVWTDEMLRAWARRDRARLAELLRIGDELGLHSKAASGMRWRLRVPPLAVRAWDELNALLGSGRKRPVEPRAGQPS